MMNACSQSGSEVHSNWHSAIRMEPPTRTSHPPSDKKVADQRSLGVWGNSMRKKTVRLAFQNISRFLQEEEREIKLEALQRTADR